MGYRIRYVCAQCKTKWSRKFPPCRPLEICYKVDGTLIEVPKCPGCVREERVAAEIKRRLQQ